MITSIQNAQVKEWKKLHKRKYRNREQRFLIEGYHLVEEAMKSDWPVIEFIISEDASFSVPEQTKCTTVSRQVFSAISETETPQGIAAVVGLKEWEYSPAPLTLLVDAVQDPGNLGTLIRTADAAGFDHIVLGTGTVDPYNDKVIRATQGSIFHIPHFKGDLEDYIEELKSSGASIWASTLQNSTPFQKLQPQEKAALIVGNEGQGISQDLVDLANELVYIPIYGEAESLNVSIAAAVLMYHMKG
ncbi:MULTISPECIES: TrmH family RNA methyltransferase [Halobacillus]|uniref:RNA methyltransferase n=1 Tax=Halobacillus halophilus (strain ATCC 35676 / DSM 2266 / JCM 20832 / KCTC 3685 / LMG 17431 / NBRC 102448 / NCIMB 2269) TaxID=866895 RepID=I0JPK5_HALH3|nr:RNA methyltransferase [Halobacillus halophilus]ASF40110.1 RNA methyltransferase [Halobacillus halophilus]CCG46075.1 RNA methyltransferase [Halobacillus halophilus DSM 2266]